MVPVRIECDCGQHYAFDVEPVNGRMSFPVACPTCGVDGTPAANEIIAGKMALTPSTPPPPPPVPVRAPIRAIVPEENVVPAEIPAKANSGLHLAGTVHAPAPVSTVETTAPPMAKIPRAGAHSAEQLGLVSREQALVDAKAKVSWGDSEETVIKYLMMQGYSYQEAADLVGGMFKERRAETRMNGIRKIVMGSGLMCVPFIAWATFVHEGLMPLKLMGIAIAIGCWGFWLTINGIIMVAAPKLETGDVAEQ